MTTSTQRKPSTYSAKVFNAIVDRMTRGESLNSAAKAEGVRPETVVKWTTGRPERVGKLTQARAASADLMVERALEVIDSEDNSPGSVARDRLRTDVLIRLAARLSPDRWGDKPAPRETERVTVGFDPEVYETLKSLAITRS